MPRKKRIQPDLCVEDTPTNEHQPSVGLSSIALTTLTAQKA